HNFNPSGDPSKIDVAQTINSGSDALAFVFEWNDPYDSKAPELIDPPIFTGSGDSEGGQAVDFGPIALEAGKSYVITEMATPATPADNFDAIVAVIDPNGNYIPDQSLTTNAFLTNRPIQLNIPGLSNTGTQVQMVIARSNTSAPANAANMLKYVFFGNGTTDCGPAEYASYTMPVTFGHS